MKKKIWVLAAIGGVLAGLAVPALKITAEKSHKTEAVQVLTALKQAQMRYFARQSIYAASFLQLDFRQPQDGHFDYAIAQAGAAGFLITATRNTRDGGDGTSTVTIDQAGTIGGDY